MQYTINNRQIRLNIEGERHFGENVVLIQKDDDLTLNTLWAKKGYYIAPLFSQPEYNILIEEMRALIVNILKDNGFPVNINFNLEKYHQLINGEDQKHLRIIKRTYEISTSLFPLGVQKIEDRISKLCNVPVQAKKPLNGEELFHLRIVRPMVTDHNPFHRDVWQEENKDAVNIYIPLFGSDEQSTLCLVPGSHYWNEADIEKTTGGAKVNGVKFNVPGLTQSKKILKIIRPNPGKNEVLVFSPYLIHGGAINLNADTTRISIEMRFWRR